MDIRRLMAALACVVHLGAYSPRYYAQQGFTDNSTATTIEAIDQVHPAAGAPAITQRGITVEAGVSKSITSFADYSGTVAGTISATTSTAHTLTTGDVVVILGTDVEAGDAAPYYGIYTITVIDTTSFYFTQTWTQTATATVIRPDYFRASVSGAHQFFAAGTFASASANQTFKISLYHNMALEPTFPISVTATNANDKITVATGTYVLDLLAGDVLWYGVTNTTSAADYTLVQATIMTETR